MLHWVFAFQLYELYEVKKAMFGFEPTRIAGFSEINPAVLKPKT